MKTLITILLLVVLVALLLRYRPSPGLASSQATATHAAQEFHIQLTAMAEEEK